MRNDTTLKDQLVVTNTSKTSFAPGYAIGDIETINGSKIIDHGKLNGDQELTLKMGTNGKVIESTSKTIELRKTNSSDSKHKVDVKIHIEGPSVVDAEDDMESSKVDTIATTGISNSPRELSNDLMNANPTNNTTPNNFTTDTSNIGTKASKGDIHSVLSDEEDKLEDIMVKDIEEASTQNDFGSDQNEREGTIIVEPPFRPCRNEINCHEDAST